MQKKFIIITSIFPPTEAVEKFAAIEGWQLVVVGDKKSPTIWESKNVIYLGPEDQEKLGFNILKHLPWNHYCRKMVGYLYAMSQGATMIADSDDDNIPLAHWPNLPEAESEILHLSGQPFVNIYKHFTKEFVWPRGYPLDRILEKKTPTATKKRHEVGIWQFLANEDPDVDAIYRLTNNKQIYFDDNEPIVLEEGTVCPFNSQDTIFQVNCFPLLYLPSFVTFRFTDILRGLVAQPLLWSQNNTLGFGSATVVQKRNPHDYMKDFTSEIPVYEHSETVISIVKSALDDPALSLSQRLFKAYEALHEAGIVTKQELTLLQAWNSDIEALAKG